MLNFAYEADLFPQLLCALDTGLVLAFAGIAFV